MAEVHLEDSGDKNMNSYQRRFGLLCGSVALIVLLISSSGQSAVSYTQFAYAYSKVTQTCPNFPSPISLLVGSGTDFLPNGNITNKEYHYRSYIKSFSILGLWVNASSIGFDNLQLKLFTTQTWFWGDNHTKSGQTNTTTNAFVTGFAAKILEHSAIVTTRHAEGNYTVVSLDGFPPLTIKLSGDNLKGTVSCGAT